MYGMRIPRVVPSNTPSHSFECSRMTLSLDNFEELDELLQDCVLRCTHPDHDALRVKMGFEEKLDPITRKLVKHG